MVSSKVNKQGDLCNEGMLSHIMWWKEVLANIWLLWFSENGELQETILCAIDSETRVFEHIRVGSNFKEWKVGDFYEAIGFDACILVEHAGLNPFGGLRSDSIPKAGCPIMCIVEEIQGPTQARARKGRFISGHAHPGSPYVFGLAEVDHDLEFPDPMPVVGISRSAKGYCLISVLETMKTYSAEEGLTEEAIVTKLRICRYHHLYLHSSLRNNSSGLGHGVSKASSIRLGPERRLVLDLRNKVTHRGLGALEDTFIAVFPDHPWACPRSRAQALAWSPSETVRIFLLRLEMQLRHDLADGAAVDPSVIPEKGHTAVTQGHGGTGEEQGMLIRGELQVQVTPCPVLVGTSRWGEFGEGGLLWGECNGKSFDWFDGSPIDELLCKVREIYGLDEKTSFRNVTISLEGRPQPLYLGTATQIGVIPTEGIPSLPKMLLPPNCAGLPSMYIRDLLLNPPSFDVASAIQEACRLMCSITCSIPEFTCIPSAKLVKLLESKEVNHIEFCRIKNVLDEIMLMNGNTELSAIQNKLLEPASVVTGLKVDADILIKECRFISKHIGEVISLAGESDQAITSSEYIPKEFFNDMESSWKGRVKRVHAEEEFANVDVAAQALSTAVTEDFLPIIVRVKAVMSSHGSSKGEISYAKEHGAVWFKGRRLTPTVWANTPGEEQIKQLKPAIDSKGRRVGEEWFTTTKVENALARYHEACDNAKCKVLELLRGLSSELQDKINILVFCSTLLIITKALFGHVSEGLRRGWVLPAIYPLSKDYSMEESSSEMDLLRLFPYWLDTNQGNAILNDVNMRSLFILTGPNGGGKSSMLRSVCAAALLGVCGLMVPAASAVIPHFDSIMLHMKAYDSPADGKSSFQIEMSEIRSLVSRATGRSLVLIDEICRGTETAKGTCIAGSIIERLDDVGCLGIVSTHLHGIFDLPLSLNNTDFKAMGAEVVNGCIQPTWRLMDGICRESLAFQTARKEGTFGLLRKDVESIVTAICKDKLLDLYNKRSISELVEVVCVTVGAREQPPPSTVGRSSIYIIIRRDNKLYVGQTDDLVGRLGAHRSKEGMQDATILYIVVPGKSVACQLETLLINQLPSKGFKLINKADGKHRNFGMSVTSGEAMAAH
uniref:DNA mismatch repair protein mutS n=1 Tax=Aegilops tauschii TaxID=37682 RepID=N1QQS7_AEGTA